MDFLRTGRWSYSSEEKRKMQSRRHEDYGKVSPSARPRRQSRYEVGHDSYPISRREGVDRSPRTVRRSFSPRGKIEGSRRMFVEDAEERRESRDYNWHSGGERTGRIRSGSPVYLHDCREPCSHEEAVHRKYYLEEMDYDDGKRNKPKQVYGYDHHGSSSRMSQDLDYSENRIADFDRRGMMEQKTVLVEDRMTRGSYRDLPDMVPGSSYGEAGGRLPLTSQSVEISQYEGENFRHREPINSEKLSVREVYKERENPIFNSRDGMYATVMAPQLKDFGSTAEYKDFSGISSSHSRTEFSRSYREGMPLPAPCEYSRSSDKPTEPMNFNTYRQRSVEDIRDHESGERLLTSYPQGAYSRKRDEQDSYGYSKFQGYVNDGIYQSDDLHDMMSPHSRFDYENAQTNHGHKESSRPIVHPSAEMFDHPEDHGDIRKSTVWDHHAIHKQEAAENVDTGRMLYPLQRDREYMSSEYTLVELGQRDSQQIETSQLGVSEDRQFSHRRSEYGFGRDSGPKFQKESFQDSPLSTYDLEMQRFSIGRKRVKEDFDKYEQRDKFLKGDYMVEESIRKYHTRSTRPSNWNGPQDFEDSFDSGGEWIYEDTDVLHFSDTQRIDHSSYNTRRKNYGKQHSGDFAYKDWLSTEDTPSHTRRHSTKSYKPVVKYVKGHARPGSSNWYNLHQTDKRSGIHGRHNTLKYYDDDREDSWAHDDYKSQRRVNLAESELPEDSEEFKQLLEEAFLLYSKQLNSNSAARRRYKEQGKAGSLFCIEFLDTRRLVTHAYMSHKTGLRARHLGLFKAICVLMGWNTVVPCDTITWVPEVLPDAEALAQKEDLMLWPPLVIIHNISMSNNNPEKQKVVPIEGVEAFLRGKGFGGGKIKVSLGKPADQSVMLVKFLGTFTGLGNAEKLHKYFTENRRGRLEFEQMTSNNSEGSHSFETEKTGEKLEEQLLYGYIGIAEDFDRLDFNTKNWIIIKSRKEIQDLANAPVKAEDA
ncbi:hypothetical protein Tsubulata_036272 [Turnera subulata]|uniref:XS domain-containing protein n=1 Tax=Turnera subulata TaxID=218843 RepID=A0A9Q0JFH4_9ROSI|nr:hypothetical protein Tsubulata_036272 [Turnera subulata]